MKPSPKLITITLAIIALILAGLYFNGGLLSIANQTRTVEKFGQTWSITAPFGEDKLSASCTQTTTDLTDDNTVGASITTRNGNCKYDGSISITLESLDLSDSTIDQIRINRGASASATGTNTNTCNSIISINGQTISINKEMRSAPVDCSAGDLTITNRDGNIIIDAPEGRLITPATKDSRLTLTTGAKGTGSNVGQNQRLTITGFTVQRKISTTTTTTTDTTTTTTDSTNSTNTTTPDTTHWYTTLWQWIKDLFSY